MNKTRYSDEQIVLILRNTDKDLVSEAVKRHGVSEPTIYALRKKFGSMELDEVKWLKSWSQRMPGCANFSLIGILKLRS